MENKEIHSELTQGIVKFFSRDIYLELNKKISLNLEEILKIDMEIDISQELRQELGQEINRLIYYGKY